MTKIHDLLNLVELDLVSGIDAQDGEEIKSPAAGKDDEIDYNNIGARSRAGTTFSDGGLNDMLLKIEQTKMQLLDLKHIEKTTVELSKDKIKISEIPELSDVDFDLSEDFNDKSDLAIQEFSTRKETIISNIKELANENKDSRFKSNVVEDVQKALNQEQVRLVKMRKTVDDDAKKKADTEYLTENIID